MMDLISCYSQYSVQITESTSCSSYTPTTSSSCIISPNNHNHNHNHNNNNHNHNSIPSTQTAVSSIYKSTLTTGDHHYITVTWYRNATAQGLQITTGDNTSPSFRLNTNSNSRLFRKKKGAKSFESNDDSNTKFEVYYDLSLARFEDGAEPVEGFYVLVFINSELGLLIGDMTGDFSVKKIILTGKFCLICRKEQFSGNTMYSTKAKFSDTGNWHDVMIRCTGENPVLVVVIDKRVVIRVKRLHWNFRGNQTIFLDGLLVDLMWDVHDWFYFNPETESRSESGSGRGSVSGRAVFMFRTRSGLDSRLWFEEKIKKSDDDHKNGFSLLVYATKS